MLNIAPNPLAANQPLRVMVESEGSDYVTLQVMDAAGRVLEQNAVKV